MRRTISALAASLALTALPARADVIAPPEDGVCPDGTAPQASHGVDVAMCRPIPCTSDASCTGGTVCADRRLCAYGDMVVDACPTGAECMSAAACTTFKVCVQPGTQTFPPDDPLDSEAGCSCRLADAARGAPWIALGAAAAATAALLRRRSARGTAPHNRRRARRGQAHRPGARADS